MSTDVMKDLLEALKIVTSQLERVGDTRRHKDGEFIDLGREAIARAEAAMVEPDSLHAGEPVAARSDEDKARLRKALDAALQRPPTRDEVIRMALKAGFTWEPINNIADPLERFAGLVASAERKACIAITKDAVEGATISKYATSLEVLAARGMATHLIDAIRARGQK